MTFSLFPLTLVALLLCSACQSGGSKLRASLGSDTHPAWSPDGSSLAYLSNRVGVAAGRPINFEIYLAASAGGEHERLTANQDFEAGLAWSPDGATLLFKSYRDGNDEVYAMDRDGAGQRNLTRNPASDGGPAWSPDGTRVLFDSDRDGERGFYWMDPDGSNVRRLPHDPGPGHSADWSPDGELVAFASDRDGNGEIYTMRADGSDVTRITFDRRENGYPRWSPDGTRLAHTAGSFETDRWALIVSAPDGGDAQVVTDEMDSGNASWSPDGRLAFGRYRRYGESGGDESRLVVIDPRSGAEAGVRGGR